MGQEFKVYRVTNLITKEIYIGATGRSLSSRWKGHVKDSKLTIKRLLPNAIRKFGERSFKMETLVKCSSERQMYDLETFFLRLCNEIGQPVYNMTKGGKGFKK